MVIQVVLESIEQGDETVSKINYTFKVLKSMCEVEKYTEGTLEELRMLPKLANNRAVYDVEKQLQWIAEKTREAGRFEEKVHRI